jgi:hypothetical protein
MAGEVTITPVAKAGYKLPDGQVPYEHLLVCLRDVRGR